jgi:ABC-type polysaccharide/polyol phosphate export permease
MRDIVALVRASWLSATSYRVAMVWSFASLVAIVVPVYFVANALQPLMQDSIRSEGGHYFAFLLVGLVATQFVTASLTALPSAIQGGIGTGTFEALLSTRARLPALLIGLIGYRFVWTALRMIVLLAAGLLLGVSFAFERGFTALVILALIVVAHLPFGLLAAAMVLAFRTSGPFPQVVLALSGFLGGVYYPTHVIPSWIQYVSGALPLTYGLRALRRTLLEGLPLQSVAGDVFVLLAFAAALVLLSSWTFGLALSYAKRSGTLAQY